MEEWSFDIISSLLGSGGAIILFILLYWMLGSYIKGYYIRSGQNRVDEEDRKEYHDQFDREIASKIVDTKTAIAKPIRS